LARGSTIENRGDPEMLSYGITGRCVTPVRVIAGNDYNEKRNIFDLGSAKARDGIKKSFMIAIMTKDAPNVKVTVGKVIPKDRVTVTIGEVKVSEVQRIFPITVEVAPGGEPIEFGGTFSSDFGKIVLETDMDIAPQIPMFIKFRLTE
jgi:hypothetical protein